MRTSKIGTTFETSIHVYRAMKRMTQQELADKVGVSRQTIIQLERNRYNPSLLLAYDIAAVFDVSIESIVKFVPKEEPVLATLSIEKDQPDSHPVSRLKK